MKPLELNNKLYGRYKITEAVLIDLINSKALQRLKGIHQAGAWNLHYSFKKSFTRYDHSLGVMLLLRKFGASIEEQIHGLLHDISHTAFSHVADFVFNKQTSQTYQDGHIGKAYRMQGVNKILTKHGFDPNFILNDKNFPLAEKSLPDLCADRLDYTLQDPIGRGLIKVKPKKVLKKLTVYNREFVFKNQAGARQFAELSFYLNKNFLCSPLQVSLYTVMAGALRESLDKNIISKKDLYQTDDFVLQKIVKSKNAEVLKKLQQIKNLKIKQVPKSQADFCGISKIRTVDPKFIKNGKLIKLTSADKPYKNKKQAWEKIAKKGFCVKILNT